MSGRPDEPKIGQLRRRVLFDTEAVYRVCDVAEERVYVEVVTGPGLRPGQRFIFTREAVSGMELVADVD